ncbi:hypothetical protein V6286_24570, partial [Enterobacter roggenkampii]
MISHLATAHRHLLHGARHPQGILLLAGHYLAGAFHHLTKLARPLPVLAGDLLGASDQQGHLIGKVIEIGRELGQLVTALGRETKSQIPLSPRYVAKGRDRLGQRRHYAAHYQAHQGDEQQGQH